MNTRPARWFQAVVALQVICLLAWAGYHEVVRRTAPTIRLKTLPVDPRDILRGDYMILNYEISLATEAQSRTGGVPGEVFVVLKPEGEHHVIDEVLAIEPAADDRRLWVRAVGRGNGGGGMRLDYGIERFFVPEGRGTPQFTTLDVEASVSAARRLYIRQVWLDNQRFP